ncbi:MAG TPA: pyridoxal phosphate-dependent aminotransferase [Bacillota bacterium]|nr:pyridoxal phosphate-dependent aminotransferase [Bacillota bacterium]
MLADKLADFGLPPQWSTMREAAVLEQEKGKKIIHMEKGDYVSQEFKPPREALEAIGRALAQGFVRYSPGPGLRPLREALAREMTLRGRPTLPEEIVVTPGAKFAIAATLLLFLGPGDEVIMPNPGYPPDEFWARYLKARIKYFSFSDPRHVDVEHLTRLITPRTRLLVLNSPQRPNGQLIENTEEIAAAMARYPHVAIVSDEIFSKIVYPPHQHRSISSFPELRDRTLVIDTFSKTYAMTGLRIGWVAAPPRLAEKIDILLQNSCTNVSTIIQEAALAALQAPASYQRDLLEKLTRKRNLAWEILSASPYLKADLPQGAFYYFVKLPGLDDKEAARKLLAEGLAVVPGSAFGTAGSGFIRLTFTLEDDRLREGLTLLTEFIGNSV